MKRIKLSDMSVHTFETGHSQHIMVTQEARERPGVGGRDEERGEHDVEGSEDDADGRDDDDERGDDADQDALHRRVVGHDLRVPVLVDDRRVQVLGAGWGGGAGSRQSICSKDRG